MTSLTVGVTWLGDSFVSTANCAREKANVLLTAKMNNVPRVLMTSLLLTS